MSKNKTGVERPDSNIVLTDREVNKTQAGREFINQLEVNSNVVRHKVESELADKLSTQLRSIGEEINKDEATEDLNYLGSAAVHVYASPNAPIQLYISQVSSLGNTPELLTIAAMRDLTGSCMEYYGKPRQKKRSGF